MSKSNLDFSFDKRVSETYDQLRAHPPEVSQQIGNAIAQVAGPKARILELGVGTGRVALPVVKAGASVVGVDLSMEMLSHLHTRATEEDLNLQVAQADICQMPFAPGVFDAVTVVHVLHLVPGWSDALAEAAAALRAQGCIILGRDWIDPTSMAGQIQNEFRKAAVDIMGPQLKAPTGGSAIAQWIEELGGVPEHLGPTDMIAAEWTKKERAGDIVNAIRTRAHSESWVITDEFIKPVADRVESFAKSNWPDLNIAHPVRHRFLLSVFRGEFNGDPDA
jgi:ubiquinone/menaquinone biosynthesis C-methylase UbiE